MKITSILRLMKIMPFCLDCFEEQYPLGPIPAYALVRCKVTRRDRWMHRTLCLRHCDILRIAVGAGDIWRGQVLRVLDPEMTGRHRRFKPFPRAPHREEIGDVSGRDA